MSGRRAACGALVSSVLCLAAIVTEAAAQEIRAGPILFRYWPGDARFAEALAAAAWPATFPALPSTVLDSGATVFLAPDELRFDSLTGARAPDWGAGVAYPDRGIIVLPAYASRRASPQDLPRVLRHELAHVALQRWLGALRSPRWFTEGYATWTAGQFDESAAWLLRLAFLTGRAPPLDSLVLDWPLQPTDARVAYLLSASAVAWLDERGGERTMRIFFERWRETGFERALFDVYGFTNATLEEYWSKTIRRRYGWLLFLAQSVVIWAITAVFVIVLFVIRRRRDRRKLAQLVATEPPDQPAWWNEPPLDGPPPDPPPPASGDSMR